MQSLIEVSPILLCTRKNSSPKHINQFNWRTWLLGTYSNQRTSLILFIYSTKTTRVRTQMTKMSTCPKTCPIPKTTICRSLWSQLTTSRIHQFHPKVTHQFQTSWAAILTRLTDRWKTRKWWTIHRLCMRDGTGRIIYFLKLISKISSRRIRRSIITRNHAPSISTIRSTLSAVISDCGV